MVKKRSNKPSNPGKSWYKHSITKYNIMKQQEKLINRRMSNLSNNKSVVFNAYGSK
jgi:hypothetical protein